MSIIFSIFVFGVIILTHEFGHFIAARKSGVLVEEFAMGMGPKLFGWKKGDTLYSLRMIPIGGFCRMMGEDADNPDERSFNKKKLSKRILIISAGSIMNFILAIVFFFIAVNFEVFPIPEIGSVREGYPAEASGLKAGDQIVSINGSSITIYDDISLELYLNSEGKPIEVGYKRDGVRYDVVVEPYFDEASGIYKMGFSPDYRRGLFAKKTDATAEFESASVFLTLKNSVYMIPYFVKGTVISIARLFTSQASVDELRGPIGIVSVVGEAYSVSVKQSALAVFLTMLNLCAFLSANLGVINLFPLPAMDGGRLIFLFIEGVRKKPVPPEKEGLVHMAGFVILMILAVFIAFNDIQRVLG